MYTKCYPNIAALTASWVADEAHFDEKWHPFLRISGRMIVLVKHLSDSVKFKPLYIHSFRLFAPHHLLEAEKFNLLYTDPSQIASTSDKLRWYRYSKGLLQRDVADYAGMDRSTYSSYEEEGRDYYPLDKIEQIAGLFDIEVTELLDDYNLFLYNDQGKQIKAQREALGMSVTEYARHLGVQAGKLRKWEANKVHIFKSTWEKYFK